MRKSWDPTVPAVVAAFVMLVGTVVATGGLGPGAWRAELDSRHGSLRLDLRPMIEHGQLRMSFDVDLDEIDGFDAATFERPGAPIRLTWKRDAGSFVLAGEGGRRPGGELQFEPNPEFIERWRALDLGSLDNDDLMRLAVEGLRLADAEGLHDLGYRGVAASEMLRLSSHGVSLEWVKEMQALGYRPDLDEIIRLRAHGVDVDEVRAIGSLGLGIEVEELLRLHNHGIDASYLRGVIEAGVSPDDLDGIVRLHSRGIAPEYVAGLRSAGLHDARIDEVARLHDHGIDTEYVRGATAGLPDLSVDDIVRLHAHGVDVDWIQGMTQLGYGSPDDLTRLHSHGVSPDLVRSLAQAGHRDLSANDLIRASNGEFR